ncbi:MAG TPA: hypothetical protein VES67_21075 [Vicinamibacterales bacterium]|nr:hypothetical protein [Vicinamibacterales bacterium]
METFTRTRITLAVAATTGAGILLLSLAAPTPAWSQTQVPPRVTREINLSGPRFGMTLLSPGTVEALADREITVGQVVSQFGWQFERRLYTNSDGVTALMEWVPLISGLEQGVALPSLNWLVGVRTASGAEFGIGPNVTPVGTGLVVAAGMTVRSGALNIPLNFAVASSKSGVRISIMTGFNIRR